MKELRFIVALFSMLLFLGCDIDSYNILNEDAVEEELTYVETLETFSEDVVNGNLRVSTLNISEDLILCADGEVLGIIPQSTERDLFINTEENALTNLWLISLDEVSSKDDINVDNAKYTWVTKLYMNDDVRVWNPESSSNNDYTSVKFLPSRMGSLNWDHVIGYINNNESYIPIAVLTPNDTDGVVVNMDFGLTHITWKYYESTQNSNLEPILLKEIVQEIVLSSDESQKDIEIPIYTEIDSEVFNMTLKNMDSNTVILRLNGKNIEDCLIEKVSGSSYIEGYKSRSYTGLVVEENNVLEVIDSIGISHTITLGSVDFADLYLSFSRETGLEIK